MQNTEVLSEPIPWFAADRRRAPDRRDRWRGGRRDTDWTLNRPAGVLDQRGARADWFSALRRLVPGRTH
jgi:hypothetical protein